MYNPVELILKKRDGKALTADEMKYFIRSYLEDRIPEYQMSALLMAIYFQGMKPEEIFALTDVYVKSGKHVTFDPSLQTVDKHSTGGVGDKITLMLAPIVAACGVTIPMISGRGLGHTGGTLDKLEAIPGFCTNYDEHQFRDFIQQNGFSIIGQTEDLVPADKHIYSLRDVTGTVESLPLITASIMSKKIAEGAQNLVIDLKVGVGAFMQNIDLAHELATLLAETGKKSGQRVSVVFTNMNSPIGEFVGNALEVRETVEYLKGKNIPDVDVITRALAIEMILLSGKAQTKDEANSLIDRVLSDGSAFSKFREFIRLQGGNPAICDDVALLPHAQFEMPILCEQEGWISTIDTRKIGYAMVDIKAGRKKIDDQLDYASGAFLPYKVGDPIHRNDTLGVVFTNDREAGAIVVNKIRESYLISTEPVASQPIILEIWPG